MKSIPAPLNREKGMELGDDNSMSFDEYYKYRHVGGASIFAKFRS